MRWLSADRKVVVDVTIIATAGLVEGINYTRQGGGALSLTLVLSNAIRGGI